MFESLHTPYPITSEQQNFFRQNGYIRLKNVLEPEVLAHYGAAITKFVLDQNPLKDVPMEERNTYQKAFIQVINLWREDETAREFVFSKRLAQIVGDLMGSSGVRLYHDQALYKEPSGGFTPWHADQYYWPLASPNTCTAWIPFQETPLAMGPLAFAVASHAVTDGRDMGIGDDSERLIAKMMENYAYDVAPFDLGEVSFHYGWTYHRAGPNNSSFPRRVMTMIYFEDGCKVAPFKRYEHENDHANFLPGTKVGEVAVSEMNPLLYQRV